jgi:hypothetical protein
MLALFLRAPLKAGQAMPKGHKAASDPSQKLARLRRRPNFVIAGGKRTLGLFVREGKEAVQPQIAIWMDAQSGAILASEVLNPRESADDCVSEALAVLVEVLQHPPPVALPADMMQSLSLLAQRATSQSTPALEHPKPGLPAKILLTDAALAPAARTLFEPLNVPVEVQTDLPLFEQAFQSLSQHLGAKEDATPPGPFAWEIAPALLPALYAAAADTWKLAPWDGLPDHPPVIIELGAHGPQPDVERLYASIMGAGGEVFGVAFYYTPEALERTVERGAALPTEQPNIDAAIELLRQAGAPIDDVPPEMLRMMVGELMLEEEGLTESQVLELMEDGMVCLFNTKEDSDPTYLDWLKAHKIKVPAREGIPLFLKTHAGEHPGAPGEREVQALTLAFQALNQFYSHFRQQLEAGAEPDVPLTLITQASLSTERVTVPVSFTPTEEMYALEEGDWLGEEEIEEPEEPATETGKRTLYRFQVKLQWMPEVWRRIEMTGDQTLHDLHNTIQNAFNWDDDHPYAFFLSGKPWDDDTAYESPFIHEGRSAAAYRLEHLPLKQGKQFLYIFDFGDDLRHEIKLEAVLPNKLQPGARYPRVSEVHGEAPPQYPDEEEESEEEDEEEEEDDEE